MTKLKVEISKKRRNSILHHLGIPYKAGKDLYDFSVVFGEQSYERSRQLGMTISEIVVEVVDRSEEQYPDSQKANK